MWWFICMTTSTDMYWKYFEKWSITFWSKYWQLQKNIHKHEILVLWSWYLSICSMIYLYIYHDLFPRFLIPKAGSSWPSTAHTWPRPWPKCNLVGPEEWWGASSIQTRKRTWVSWAWTVTSSLTRWTKLPQCWIAWYGIHVRSASIPSVSWRSPYSIPSVVPVRPIELATTCLRSWDAWWLPVEA